MQGLTITVLLGALALYASSLLSEAGEMARGFYGVAFGLTWLLGMVSMVHRWHTFGASVFQGGFRAQLVGFPSWFGTCYVVLFLVLLAHFVLSLLASSAGVPEIQDGSYVLVRHGVAAQTISRDRYFALRGNEARLFAMFSIAFNFFVSTYWWFGAGSARPGSPWVKPEYQAEERF